MKRLINWFRRPFGKLRTRLFERDLRCEEVQELSSDYVDATLSASIAGRFRHHLATCPDCNRFVATLRATVLSIRDIPFRKAPPDLQERVRARLRQEGRGGTSGQGPN